MKRHDLVDFLFEEAEYHKMSLNKLAALADLPRSTIRSWERGAVPTVVNLEKALAVFGYKFVAILQEKHIYGD